MRGTYDINRFRMVEVKMDKKDYAIDNLIEDLESWMVHLYRVDDIDKESIIYRGLLPIKEIGTLELLTSVSPYGNGYYITVEGERETKIDGVWHHFMNRDTLHGGWI